MGLLLVGQNSKSKEDELAESCERSDNEVLEMAQQTLHDCSQHKRGCKSQSVHWQSLSKLEITATTSLRNR